MPEYIEATVDKFIFRVATDRLYSPNGVWAMAEGSRVRIGLSDYLQQLNGDVAFVHVKPAGTKVFVADEVAELETIKANVSLLTPISGTLVEANVDLDLTPEVVNQQPYGKGWIALIEATDWERDRTKLLDPQAYLSAMRSQALEELKKQ